MKNLVLIGGGHSHVAVLKSFGMKPVPGVRLTVICRDTHTPYSGMLPGLIAGHYTFDDIHIDLRRLTQFAGGRFYKDDAVGMNFEHNRVLCRAREPVPFDLCSINVGSVPATVSVPGGGELATPVKPIAGFLDYWRTLMDIVKSPRDPFVLGIVGAGASGVELTLSAQHAFRKALHTSSNTETGVTLHLFGDGERITPTHNPGVSRKLLRALIARGVHVHVPERVVRVTRDGVELESGKAVDLDAVLWTTQAMAPGWLASTDLELTHEGFIRIDDCLRSVSHPSVFASGDVATMVNHHREKAGVMAVRQGPPLARNLRLVLEEGDPLPFAPQKKWLSLISTGDRNAVASWRGFSTRGSHIWRWKDWIDRRFMDKYATLPDMAANNSAPSTENIELNGGSSLDSFMRCGGCGAKIGSIILMRALERLNNIPGNGIEEFEDATIVMPPQGKVLLHTIDFFRAFIDDPYLFGRISAAHALGDIYAMGGAAHSALSVAVLPPGLNSIIEEDLFLMLRGALETFSSVNVELMGGHSGEGTEIALGFAINGFAPAERILRKGGMQENDALILTKPLGTGTLLAAHMQLKAKGRWIDQALEVMMETSEAAGNVFAVNGATACTDVTGFGLAGHALEMARASGIGCEINLSLLPVLTGAEEMLAQGIRSTLHPQNARAVEHIANTGEASIHPLYSLLFDPQTSGGLLASVPQDRVLSCLGELTKVGHGAARVIGVVKGGKPKLSLTGF
jgi:selenide,water dikinase